MSKHLAVSKKSITFALANSQSDHEPAYADIHYLLHAKKHSQIRKAKSCTQKFCKGNGRLGEWL
ncbi:MAG: hypothetical protein IKQ68_06805, partial [Prevotella sp.]|nr:hypothetical protein [Prevotella sp.]